LFGDNAVTAGDKSWMCRQRLRRIQAPVLLSCPLALSPLSCETRQMLLRTPILYLDHSAISNEKWWPQIDAVLATGQIRLALSVWNLVEIGSATDRNQQDRRLAFLEQHHPLWI